MIANDDLRKTMRANQISQWKLAEKIGVCELTIQRWFRHELDDQKHQRVTAAINEILNERK